MLPHCSSTALNHHYPGSMLPQCSSTAIDHNTNLCGVITAPSCDGKVRENHAAEADAKRLKLEDGHDRYGKLSLDGMDEAKWICPQKLPDSADFEPLWKAKLHMVCCICHGIVEAYYIMPPDLPKDSNMENTITSRTLDVAQELLPPGTKLPHSFGMNTDNTAKEMKNTHGATHSAYQVASNKFEGLHHGFQKTGRSYVHAMDELKYHSNIL